MKISLNLFQPAWLINELCKQLITRAECWLNGYALCFIYHNKITLVPCLALVLQHAMQATTGFY